MLILVLVLLSWHLLAQSMSPASAVVILEPIFDPSECVKVGSAISFSCTVEDSKGYSATIWSGGVSSIQVFNCPSPNSITRDRLFLSHSASQPVAFCGDRAFARLNSVTNKTVYTSILYLYNTTLNMNGGYVRCTDLNSQTYEQIQLSIEAIPLAPTCKLLQSRKKGMKYFTVSWEIFNSTIREIGHYSTSVAGDSCGICSNIGNNISTEVNELSCWGWEPNGQVCNVTVTAVEPICGFVGRSSLLVNLIDSKDCNTDLMWIIPSSILSSLLFIWIPIIFVIIALLIVFTIIWLQNWRTRDVSEKFTRIGSGHGYPH